MDSFQKNIEVYKAQLEKGSIQKAYRGLMEFIMGLKTHFMKTYPDYTVSGNIYFGYMDMTYFSIIPKPLKTKKLKIAIVFLHETFRFEVWLSAVNRQVQARYYEIIKKSGWKKYKTVPQEKGIDSIVEHVLVNDPDFSNLKELSQQLESGVLNFIKDIEKLLLQINSIT
jgi:hypothetical protein